MRVCGATLTVLLVEPPQLDLVGFVLGLLLQPAGPGGGGGGGEREGGAENFNISLWNSSTVNTHNSKLKASRLLLFSVRLPRSYFFTDWKRLILKSWSGRADVTRARPRSGGAHGVLKETTSRLSPVFVPHRIQGLRICCHVTIKYGKHD